jgi:cellulose synthase operon protein C
VATEEELRAWLQEAAEMPYGPAQIALVEQVIQHADAGRLTDVAFAARMLGTSAYLYGGEPAKSFVTFSWCLAEYDRDPAQRSASDDHRVLWHFKNVVGTLTKFPEIPLDRVYAVLDDMERRYRIGGHSMHAVYAYRHWVAAHLGDTMAADEWYGRWCAAPRDELSDCAGCDPTSKAEHLAANGRDEEAVVLAEPVLSGQLHCVQQPHGILSALLLPYLRTGRLAEAAGAHRRGYRRLRPHLRNLARIGEHVQFCALTGNEARGLEIVQRHLDWLDRPVSPYAAMQFASAGALVLRRLAQSGHGDLAVPRGCGETTVGRLADELAGSATALAARFDERNGTKHQSGRIAARLEADPLVEHLPLSPGATGPALRRRAAPEGGGPNGLGDGKIDVPLRSAGELLDLAERLARTDRLGEARAVWRAFDERFPADQLAPREAARRAEGRGRDLAERRDLAGAEAAWRCAAELYRKAGDEVGAQAASGRIGLLLCLSDRAGEGLPQVEQTTAYLLAHGSAERRASAESRLGTALLAAGRPMESLAALDRAATHAAESGDAYLVADLELRRAHCLSTLHRVKEQREAAAQARELFRGLSGEGYAEACLLYGDSFREPGEATTALAAYDEAVRAATAYGVGGSGRVMAEARLARARSLAGLGRAAEAVEDFVEVVAGYTELEAPDGATFARYELAGAYRQAGRLAEAAEAAEEAVAGLDRLGEVQAADRCRHLLAGIYREMGEDEPALALLDQLATNLDGFDNLPARARMYEEAGEIHYQADRDLTAANRFAAAATAFAKAGSILDELRARRRAALALHWAGDRDAALAALAEVDALAAKLPAGTTEPAVVWEKAMTGYETTKILIGADRLDEALPRIEAAPAAFRSIEAFGEALLAELLLGELLLRMSRPGDAEPVLRAVLAGLPRDAEPVPQAAWLLAEALAMLGRSDEAAELRTRYGLSPD